MKPNLRYFPDFLSTREADSFLHDMLTTVEFNAPSESRVFVHGRWREIPRLQCAFGDAGTSYRFSGCNVPARPWIEPLGWLRQRLACQLGIDANFVLINQYRNGADSIGWHRDDERDLGSSPTIASLSLGAERDFQLRPVVRDGVAEHATTIRLAHGSLLVMDHPTNQLFQHQLPRRGGTHPERVPARLNLTWRLIAKTAK